MPVEYKKVLRFDNSLYFNCGVLRINMDRWRDYVGRSQGNIKTKIRKLRQKKYYLENREQILAQQKEYRKKVKEEKQQYFDEHPEKREARRQIKNNYLSALQTRKRNIRKPQESYMNIYWRILLAPESTHPILNSNNQKIEIDFDKVLEQLEQIRIAKRHFTIERKKHLQRAWELDLPVKDYIDEIKRIDAKKAQEENEFQDLEQIIEESLHIVESLAPNADITHKALKKRHIKDYLWWQTNYRICLAQRKAQRARRKCYKNKSN